MSNVPAAEEFFKRIRDATAQAKLNIEQAQLVQKQQADRSRRYHSFKIGDMVYLTAKHIKQQSGVSKLNPLARGPFKIVRQINENAFALKLPPTWRIKNVFHVSKLRLAHRNDDNQFPLRRVVTPDPPEVKGDGSEEYTVEKIIDRRKRYNRWEYRVRWQGYGPEEDTWEIMRNLTNARDAVKEFEDSLNSAQFNESRMIQPISNEELTAAVWQHIAQRKARMLKRTSGKQLIVNPDRIENSQQCQATTRWLTL